MSRAVHLESGWLSRQLNSAQERANQLPNWLKRPSSQQQAQSPSSSSESAGRRQPTNVQKPTPQK